jgi:hypothetical protein
MNERPQKERLGRNPFEQKKPARKHRAYEERVQVQTENSEQAAQASRAAVAVLEAGGENRLGLQNPLIGDRQQLFNVPVTATLAWLWLDLWTSSFFEPMFFWMNSPKIVRETIKAASGRGA